MARTQAAVAAGVGRCLLARGVRRTTMVEIAAEAGIAKATLYNHVRTKGEALALYADEQVEVLLGLLAVPPEVTQAGTATALVEAGDAVAGHAVVRRLAAEEPAALAALLVGPLAAERRDRVREVLEDLLGTAVAPLTLRWLVSLLTDPGTPEERRAEAHLLVAASSGQLR